MVAALRSGTAMMVEPTAADRTELQTPDELEATPLGIDDDVATELVATLNDSLATLQILARQVQKHHWNVEGPEFLSIHEFLGDAYENLEDAIDELAERVAALGGVPVAGPEAATDRSLVSFEGETVYDIRSSLEADRAAYETLARTLREDARLAQQLGDLGTADLLQDILSDVEEDVHHVDHFLGDDTLQRRD
jgi:DNA-binding ferritin-like protein